MMPNVHDAGGMPMTRLVKRHGPPLAYLPPYDA